MAIGVALATPGKRVVAIVGDAGLALLRYPGALDGRRAPPSPITFVIVNNGGYGAMKVVQSAVQLETFARALTSGTSISVALARGFGMAGAARVERAAELLPALEASHRAAGPILVDVVVDSAPKTLF